MYVNGVLKATYNMPGSTTTGGYGIRLMKRWDGNDFWGGALSQVKMYDRALSATEVSTNWYADRARYSCAEPVTRGLVLLLDAATVAPSATTWVDSVGGRSFALINGPTWTAEGGGSLAFVAAASQYAESASALPSMSVWTLEAWIKPSGLYFGSNPAFISDKQGTGDCNYMLGFPTGTPNLQTGYIPTSGGWLKTGTTVLTTGSWSHVVACEFLKIDSSQRFPLQNMVFILTHSHLRIQPSTAPWDSSTLTTSSWSRAILLVRQHRQIWASESWPGGTR